MIYYICGNSYKVIFTTTLIVFLLSTSLRSGAQNMVPNPGFENYTTCPVGFSEFDGFVSDWNNPSIASPDYMNGCANPLPAGVPQNGVGYQQAHSGNGYAGCYFNGGGFYTEYVQVQLSSPLVAGNEYLFKMYVVLHNKSDEATDDIGAYFSVTAPSSTGVGYLNGNPLPQISNAFGNVITDTLNWQLISGTYVASGGESYLTIGHFKPDSVVTYVSLPYGNLGPYYYIDDVSLESQSSTNFAATDTNVCEKFCVDFFDQSSNNPTSWHWLFPGGTPSSSSDQNPVQICYQTPGVFDVTLITTNVNGDDTLTLAGYVTVNATPSVPVITQNGLLLTSSSASNYQWQFNTVNIPGATNQSYTINQTGFYTVIVTDDNGCQNSSTTYILIDAISDVFNDGNIVIYPNPANGIFNIEFNSQHLTGQLSIYVEDEMGRVVFSSNENISGSAWKKEIDLRESSTGIYFIHLVSQDGELSKKIMIY